MSSFSFFRRLSFTHSKPEPIIPLTIKLNETDQDRLDEINRNFTHKDSEIFGPQLVRDMKWELFSEEVLDYGCGSGRIAFNHILPQVYMHDSHLFSVDNSESMISYASMKYPHPTVTYAKGDIMGENFPFKNMHFDKIFLINVLQCIKGCRQALSRFYEALKPGGQIGILMPTNYFCNFLDKQFYQSEKWGQYFENIRQTTVDYEEDDDREENFQQNFHYLLDNIGYEIVKIRTEKMHWIFPTLEKAVVFYMATSPYVKEIPAELQDPFEEECLDKMKEFEIQSVSDPYDMLYNCLYVVARKPGQPGKDSGVLTERRRSRLSLP